MFECVYYIFDINLLTSHTNITTHSFIHSFTSIHIEVLVVLLVLVTTSSSTSSTSWYSSTREVD
jgi:hypothetical protein